MLRHRIILLFAAVSAGVGGCRDARAPAAREPYADLPLGAPLAEAVKLVGREGEAADHDQVPVRPLPRKLSPRIPEATRWYVWWREKDSVKLYPELVLGVSEGRIVYKQVIYEQDGATRSAIRVLPEFQ